MGKQQPLIALILYLCAIVALPSNALAGGSVSITTGGVYEFTDEVTLSRGVRAGLKSKARGTTLYYSYRVDAYDMKYYAIRKSTTTSATHSTISKVTLDSLNVSETRHEARVLADLNALPGTTILAGLAYTLYDNPFSAMTLAGPSLSAMSTTPALGQEVEYGIDISVDLFGGVTNKDPDFYIPKGEKTISYYGEPEYSIGLWGRVSPEGWPFLVGYEATLCGFKYAYRYMHSVVLTLVF